MFGFFTQKQAAVPLEVSGIRVRASRHARRLALRVDARTGDVLLTWPARGASLRAAEKFITQNSDWIDDKRRNSTSARRFLPGAVVPVHGCNYTVLCKPGRGRSRFEGGNIVVFGDESFFSSRLRRFLKEEATRILASVAAEKMAVIGRAAGRVRVIDPKTRWGSCSRSGGLMFSWRLILMPPFVLDYIVAHEVAHCIHMNHSKKFWALCHELAVDARQARLWLKQNGAAVMGWR